MVAGATLGASAVFATSAQGAGNTYTVTTSGDDTPAVACNTDNTCNTLRDAIYTANKDGGDDTIQFASGLANETITLTHGVLTITAGGITIQNPNAPGLAVSGNNSSGVFDNEAPSTTKTTISGLTVENGNDRFGGGILSDYSGGSGAALALGSDVVKDSHAKYAGGGVWTGGPVTITSSQITGNTTDIVGGGVDSKYGNASITNSTISDNSAPYGAGIFAENGDGLSVSGSQITGNTKPTTNNNGRGGGISSYYAPLSVTNSTISNNTSGSGGGISDYSFGATTLSNLTVSGNTGTNQGGGIHVVGEDPPVAASRQAARRAALEQRLSIALPSPKAATSDPSYGPISVSDSTISGNTSPRGAGIDVGYTTNAAQAVTVTASTLSDNGPPTNPSPASSFGGGLLIGGTLQSPFELINSTISGNTANNGGGVSVGDGSRNVVGTGGSIAFDNSTIASNSASASGGGGGIFLSDYGTAPGNSATATIFSTIVAGDTAAGAGNDLARASGSTTGGFNTSYSLIQQPGNAPLLTQQSIIKGVDPQLGSLANNGGLTQTRLPAFTSPVIDQGKAASGLTTDQRGDPRTVNNGKPKPPGGDGTDIGSVEVQKIPIVATIAPATGVTAWQGTLNGEITTNGQSVTWHFQWGTTTGYGQNTGNGQALRSESITAPTGQTPVSFQITGLHPHTVYHYRLVAVAVNGSTADSSDGTFETLTPTIKANPATVRVGNKTQISGFAGGCPVGDRVTLISAAFPKQHVYAGSWPAIFATVKPGGNYAVTTKIPKSKNAGRYAITAACGVDGFATKAFLRVRHPHPHVAKVQPVKVVKFTG